MRLLLILLLFSESPANQKLARVIDKDGFSNVRSGQGLSFEIVDKVTTHDFFYCEPVNNSDWVKVSLLKWHSGDQITGYIHKSSIQIIEELSNEEQKEIILTVLARQKLLANKFVESYEKYNKELQKWNNKADSISYRKTVSELELYSETAYSPILQHLPKIFCSIKDNTIIKNLFETILSDKGSANEQPAFAIGECFACDTTVLSTQIRQLKNSEQKELIISEIEFGLLNKFSVDENKASTHPNFLKLKEHLDSVRD